MEACKWLPILILHLLSNMPFVQTVHAVLNAICAKERNPFLSPISVPPTGLTRVDLQQVVPFHFLPDSPWTKLYTSHKVKILLYRHTSVLCVFDTEKKNPGI